MHILSPVTDNCSSWINRKRNETTRPDRVSNPGPLALASDALPTALRGPANNRLNQGTKSRNKMHKRKLYIQQASYFSRSSFINTGYKRVCQFSLPAETVHHIWLPPRLSAISCFLPRLLCSGISILQKLSVWLCCESRQEAESNGQSLQKAIFRRRYSRQEGRDHGQSRRKPNMADSLCKKRKWADSFIPCEKPQRERNFWMDGWMDGWRDGWMTQIDVLFNSISVQLGRRKGDNERLCEMEL